MGGTPPNHLFKDGIFHEINHPFRGPHFGKHPHAITFLVEHIVRLRCLEIQQEEHASRGWQRDEPAKDSALHLT